MRNTTRWLAAFGLVLLTLPGMSQAKEPSPRFAVGAEIQILLGDGKPSNDMPSYGLAGRYQINEKWTIGAALHTSDWDFEHPARLLGIVQSTTVDAVDSKVSEESLSAWLESEFDGPFGLDAFWQLGGGAANIDANDAAGPTATGGTFNIVSDFGTTTFVFGTIGVRGGFAERWYWEAALRLEQRFGDIRFVDTVSSTSGTLDWPSLYGGYLGFGYKF
jgi:hypothetical protein